MLPQEIIIDKRNKEKLSKEEIDAFVNGIVTGEVNDAQIASFTMTTLLNKLSKSERINLTMAMAKSGRTFSYPKSISPIIDKHSTGGVGDKVSLMLAPIAACLGLYDPMIAGRGLGHTGGTIDKLESIPGYNCYPTEAAFKKVIAKVGCGIMGATDDIAPADKHMYAIRDISGTVESMDLITASILSKKLAAGLDGLVMDVKYGNGAFMSTKRKAKKLAKYIESVGNGAGMPTKTILTDMNQPLGKNIGNAVEVIEAINFLKGDYDKKLYNVTEKLAVEMILLARKLEKKKKRLTKSTLPLGGSQIPVRDLVGGNENVTTDTPHPIESRKSLFSWTLPQGESAIRRQIHEVIHNGEALAKFQEMVSAMGGPKDLIKNPEKHLKLAKFKKDIYPLKEGKAKSIDTRAIGIALIELGGGRTDPDQGINHSVGFVDFCKVGDKIGKKYKKPIATVYARTKADISKAEKNIKKAVKVK